jgi:hydroxymethylpyrimidine pyrophosphatase-like HAD family hydrolase
MLKQTLILVPANFSSEVIKNNDSSLIAAFLGLKTYAIGGCITNYKSEINNIAQFFGCSSKTVQYLIKDLIKEELAWVWGVNLRLASCSKLFERYSLFEKNKEYVQFQKSYKRTKDFFRKKAIEDNLKLQNKINNIEFKKSLKDKKVAIAEARREIKILRSRNNNSFNGYGENVKISHKGIAKLFGSNWHSAGTYWVNKLKNNNEIETQKQNPELLYSNVGRDFFNKMRNSNPEYPLIYKNNSIYQCQCSKIRIIND